MSYDGVVQELVDRLEIRDLMDRLGIALDDGRVDDLRVVFSEDVQAEFPPTTLDGLDELVEYGRQATDAFDRVQHAITNVVIDLDGDRASVRANLLAFAVHHGGDPSVHLDLGGVYAIE